MVTQVYYTPIPIYPGWNDGTINPHGSPTVTPIQADGIQLVGHKAGDGISLGITTLDPMQAEEIQFSFPAVQGDFRISLTDDSTGKELASTTISNTQGMGSIYRLSFKALGRLGTLNISALSANSTLQISYLGVPHDTLIAQQVVATVCNSEKYRYGFNGQMKVNEWAGLGNHNSAKFWEYDTRIGRRANVDPEFDKYPSQSPYSAFNGNPIFYADPKGNSGVVTISGNTVTISSTLVFYGSQATTKIAQATASEIQNMYNAAKATVMIDGKEYSVNFKINFQVKSESDAVAMAQNNKSARYNFIRVEDHIDSKDPSAKDRSQMNIAENSGYFVTTDDLGHSTTAAHEYGHGMGLLHPQDEGVSSLEGMGQPNIMAPRGTQVDAKYRRNPKDQSSRINPITRKVLKSDIMKMAKSFSYNSETKEYEIGKATNKIYTETNDKTTPANEVQSPAHATQAAEHIQ